MPKFNIEVWVDQEPEKLKLGTVTVEAKTEAEAFNIAWRKTEHWMVGEVEV